MTIPPNDYSPKQPFSQRTILPNDDSAACAIEAVRYSPIPKLGSQFYRHLPLS